MLENFSAWHNIPMETEENGFAGLDTKFTFNNAAVKRHMAKLGKRQKSGIFSYAGRRL